MADEGTGAGERIGEQAPERLETEGRCARGEERRSEGQGGAVLGDGVVLGKGGEGGGGDGGGEGGGGDGGGEGGDGDISDANRYTYATLTMRFGPFGSRIAMNHRGNAEGHERVGAHVLLQVVGGIHEGRHALLDQQVRSAARGNDHIIRPQPWQRRHREHGHQLVLVAVT